jgi:hypothetical protein
VRVGQKHHYIPVFYLKQWQGPNGRLCEISKPFKKAVPRRTHPDGTGYVRGLYTIPGATPETADYLETEFLKKADDLASRALCRMLAGDMDLSQEMKSAWSRFILSLLHRTPEAMERALARVSARYVEEIEAIRTEYISLRGPNDPATVEEFEATVMPFAIRRFLVDHVISIIDSENVCIALNGMTWGIVTMHRQLFPLLTSDRPIVMTNGLAGADAHIVMPVSPKHIFIAAKNEKTAGEIHRLARDGTLVLALNDRVVRQARKYVYATDDQQLRFIANRLGAKEVNSPWE